MIDLRTERETIFLSGIDQSIKESDIKEFFGKVARSDPLIRFHYFSALNKPHVVVEALLPTNDAILAHQHLNNTRLKGLFIKLLPKNTMKSLIITNIPAIISEKDLFLIIARMTPGLKRIIIADDPEICGKTLELAVAIYQTHENARDAMEIFSNNNKILGKTVSAAWKEPSYDILGELAFDTRVLYIKNISPETTVERLRDILSHFGKVLRIKKLADKAFIEFDEIKCARKALESCQEKRFDGMIWRIFPAKKFDEEKAKENPDKNVIYSKSFLEETDQQVLLKFMYDGMFPEVNSLALHRAATVLEAAKSFQRTSLEHFKQQHEIIANLQAAGHPIQPQNSLSARELMSAEQRDLNELEESNPAPVQINGLSKNQMRKLKKQKKGNKKGPNRVEELNNLKVTQKEVSQAVNLSFGNNEVSGFENTSVSYKALGGGTPNNHTGSNIGATGSMSPFARNLGNNPNLIQGFQSKF